MAFSLSSCAEKGPHTHGLYMLLDTSGTYTQELKQAQKVINYSLSQLNPGDTFAVARVDTGSFSEKDIIYKQTFEDRPSMANEQKRQFREKIDAFVKSVQGSKYTDITGGILQAAEYLNEVGSGRKTIIIFSDLKEEVKPGFVRDIPFQLDGFRVVALNVTKLRSDNVDPREYMKRLEDWEKRVTSGGGKWRVINDLERLEPMFNE
ncbi:MAG: VWA domain-containing protein [Gammaproteobacteria bacterium]|nr:VWA domain-containing protein [Gammaproteobacteria bacterium]MDH5652923.1 VWA domain-containing protein [Gammaproteobacteria bacterium]